MHVGAGTDPTISWACGLAKFRRFADDLASEPVIRRGEVLALRHPGLGVDIQIDGWELPA